MEHPEQKRKESKLLLGTFHLEVSKDCQVMLLGLKEKEYNKIMDPNIKSFYTILQAKAFPILLLLFFL